MSLLVLCRRLEQAQQTRAWLKGTSARKVLGAAVVGCRVDTDREIEDLERQIEAFGR